MAYVNVAEWKPDQVTDWLKGLDDVLLPYLHSFLNNEINGQYLLNLQHDDLERLGVFKLGHQEIILEAVEQLRNFHYDLDRENLQLLALRLSSSAHSLHNELLRTQPNSTLLSTQTLADVANIVTTIKPLVCWLDRSPFSGQVAYNERKSELLKLSLEMATSGQRDRFAENPTENIRSSCEKLAILADQIIQETQDPLILQPASLDLVTVKKRPGDHLGFYIVPSFHGIHQIGELKCNSAAHQCGKIECGDEIVQINYQTVVGWQVKQVMVLFEESSSDVFLTLKKRPRHTKVFGQIYMKPYRLPSKKHAVSYTSRWHDSLPSPRPELLSIPRFELPLTTYNESIRELSDECKDESTSSSDEDIGHASPTSMRLYLPKPRVPAQRRATITGASPVSKRPPINLDQFWHELKLVRQWRSTSEENKKFNSETLLRRSIDSPLSSIRQEDVQPKCSSAQCLVGSGNYEDQSLEKDKKPKDDILEREKANSQSVLQEECKFISLKERIEMFSKHDKVINSNNINSQVSKPKVPPKNFKLDQINKFNKPEENINISFVAKVKQRGKLDKSYSTPAYDLNTSEIVNANTIELIDTFEQLRKKSDIDAVNINVGNINAVNTDSNLGTNEISNFNFNNFSSDTTIESINNNLCDASNISNSGMNDLSQSDSNSTISLLENSFSEPGNVLDNSLPLQNSVLEPVDNQIIHSLENKCNISDSNKDNVNNINNSTLSNISGVNNSNSINYFNFDSQSMELDSPRSEHGQMVNTINDNILLKNDDEINRNTSSLETCDNLLVDDIDVAETTKMNEILETISSSLSRHQHSKITENHSSPKFKTDNPETSSGLSSPCQPAGSQPSERFSPKLKTEDSYYYCNLYLDSSKNHAESVNFPQPPSSDQAISLASIINDKKSYSRSESPYERLVINQQTYSNECYSKPSSLDLGLIPLNSPEIRITTPTSVKSDLVDFDSISLSSVSSSPAPATFPRHRTDKKPLTPPPRPAKPAAESKGGCYRAMMVAKSMGKSATFKVTASPRLLRKKNPLLNKRRNISVKELGVCDCQGWLSQRVRGSAGAQWNKGWFALKGTSFFGFNSNDSQKARVMIFLPGFTVSPAEEVKSRKYAFKVYHAGTTFYFAADSNTDMSVWVDAITASTIANDIHTETIIFSETDGEEEESQSEPESCFPSPKMKKFSGLFSSDASGKSSEFQKKFGSLKKLGSRSKPPPEEIPSSESLDRKYLKFLGPSNVPVPTAQFRSYRRVPPSPPATSIQRRKDNIHHCSAESVLAHSEKSLSECCNSPVNMNLPPDMGDYRLASLARARDINQRRGDQENPGLVTLEAFMLARQEEERRQQQDPPRGVVSQRPHLTPQTTPRSSDLDSLSDESQYRSNRSIATHSSSNRLRYTPQPSREFRGKSSEKLWIDSLRRSDARIQTTAHSTNTVPDLRTKRLKKAANYQPPPVSPLDNASPGPSDMRFAFEMTLDQSQNSSKKNSKQSQPTARLKSFFSPTKNDPNSASQKTLLGSPRLHRVLFREKRDREPPVPPPRPPHTLQDRSEDDQDPQFLNNSRSSGDSFHLRPAPPDYPGLEYPPVFEPETYSLSSASTLKRDKNTKDDSS